MLPSVPKSLGRLSDVFVSSLGSITGKDNRLGLPRARRVCTVLVDGLGSENIRNAAGHARFLNETLAAQRSITCGFPSTTATNISSFATGLMAGAHGLVGYQVMNPADRKPVNLLTGWNATVDPLKWQPSSTVTEAALSSGVACYVIGPKEYQDSGFTRATMRTATYLVAKSISERFELAKKMLHGNTDALIYLYVPELDQAAHAFGSQSSEWLAQVEILDGALKSTVQNLPRGAGLSLTADHGIIDVASNRHIFLDEYDGMLSGLELAAGDPRVSYLYFEPDPKRSFRELALELQVAIGSSVVACETQSIIDAGWYGKVVSTEAQARLPQISILSLADVALYHRRFAKAKSLNMIGQHGSISPRELRIPLLGFGAFA